MNDPNKIFERPKTSADVTRALQEGLERGRRAMSAAGTDKPEAVAAAVRVEQVVSGTSVGAPGLVDASGVPLPANLPEIPGIDPEDLAAAAVKAATARIPGEEISSATLIVGISSQGGDAGQAMAIAATIAAFPGKVEAVLLPGGSRYSRPAVAIPTPQAARSDARPASIPGGPLAGVTGLETRIPLEAPKQYQKDGFDPVKGHNIPDDKLAEIQQWTRDYKKRHPKATIRNVRRAVAIHFNIKTSRG